MPQPQLPGGFSWTARPQPALRIDTAPVEGLVYLQGAQVAAWRPVGQQPALWLADPDQFRPGTAIRGGIPVCFPWFGPGSDANLAPAHGFARLLDWTLLSAELDAGGVAEVRLQLTAQQCAGQPHAELFPGDWVVQLTARLGAELDVQLDVQAGDQPLVFEEALHTYYAVSDIRRCQVTGLDGAGYFDNVGFLPGADPGPDHPQQGTLQFTGETDRVYHSSEPVRLTDGERTILITKQNSADTVVWNPWADKAADLPDVDGQWTRMCCVEVANCKQHAVHLAAGARHTMGMRVQLLPADRQP